MSTHRRSSYAGPDRRTKKPSLVLVAVAAAGVLAITYATLCPLGMRPHLGNANLERFGAYLVLGLLVSLAAPRRSAFGPAIVVMIAFALEAAQLLVHGRDAVFADACVKATGGVLGAQAGFASFALRRYLTRGASQTGSRRSRRSSRMDPQRA